MGFFSKIVSRKKNQPQLKNLRRRLEDEFNIVAGVAQDATPYPDGTPTALVAAANEFGTPTIPERSFMRSTMDEEQEKYFTMGEQVAQAAADGKITLRRGAQLIGLTMQNDIRQKITDLKSPPNAPSTIRQKGSANPLVDTAHMRGQVTFEVRECE